MKFSLFISVALVAVAVGDDPLIGKWTEDSSRRENLKEFLKARGKSIANLSAKWQQFDT